MQVMTISSNKFIGAATQQPLAEVGNSALYAFLGKSRG